MDCGKSRELLLCIKSHQEKALFTVLIQPFFFFHTALLSWAFRSRVVVDLGFLVCFVGDVSGSFPGR